MHYHFKLVYSNRTKTYDLDLSQTTANIYDTLKPLIYRDFGLESFDIIIAGQERAERAEPIQYDHTQLNIRSNLSFYIRSGQISNQTESNQTQLNQTESNVEHFECPLCFISSNSSPIITHYSCQHTMCDNCYNRWANTSFHNNNRCPLCRQI